MLGYKEVESRRVGKKIKRGGQDFEGTGYTVVLRK